MLPNVILQNAVEPCKDLHLEKNRVLLGLSVNLSRLLICQLGRKEFHFYRRSAHGQIPACQIKLEKSYQTNLGKKLLKIWTRK